MRSVSYAVCAILLILLGVGVMLLRHAYLASVTIVEPESSLAPLDSYPPEQVATMRLYVEILREADAILADEAAAVEERVARLEGLCPRMQALAQGMDGMSNYRRDDLQEVLGWGWEKLPTLKAVIDHHFATLGNAPAEGEDRRLSDATLHLMGSDRYGKLPCDITPEETVQSLLQHIDALHARLQRCDLSEAERLEALRLGSDHLHTLALPLSFGEDGGQAYCQEVVTRLKATPGAVQKLRVFRAFITPAPKALQRVRSYLEYRIVEKQQSYHRYLCSLLQHELAGLLPD